MSDVEIGRPRPQAARRAQRTRHHADDHRARAEHLARTADDARRAAAGGESGRRPAGIRRHEPQPDRRPRSPRRDGRRAFTSTTGTCPRTCGPLEANIRAHRRRRDRRGDVHLRQPGAQSAASWPTSWASSTNCATASATWSSPRSARPPARCSANATCRSTSSRRIPKMGHLVARSSRTSRRRCSAASGSSSHQVRDRAIRQSAIQIALPGTTARSCAPAAASRRLHARLADAAGRPLHARVSRDPRAA